MGEASNSGGKYKYSPLEIVVGVLFWGAIAFGVFAYFMGSMSEDNDDVENNREISQVDPYPGYNDGVDQDCADVGMRVYVGNYDPDRLDADGDGWGCESYGG